jgi:hypothetical protein
MAWVCVSAFLWVVLKTFKVRTPEAGVLQKCLNGFNIAKIDSETVQANKKQSGHDLLLSVLKARAYIARFGIRSYVMIM